MTKSQPQPPTTVPEQWRVPGRAAVAATAIAGGAYGAAEFAGTGAVKDAGLILIVILNAVIVYRFGYHIAPRLGELMADFPGHSKDPQAAVDRILGHRFALFAGFIYAAMIGGGIWILNPWGADWALRACLAGFIFTGSVITGIGIFAVIRFWRLVLSALPDLDIRILNLSRPPVVTLLRVNSQIVMVTALVACLAILSVVVANYKSEPEIILFSLFAFTLVVATYAVPVLPLSERLRIEKAAELDRIEKLIEAHVHRLSGQDPRPGGPEPDAKLPELEELIEARAIVSRIRTLPPGGQGSISVAGIVTLLSFLPALLDFVQKAVTKGGG